MTKKIFFSFKKNLPTIISLLDNDVNTHRKGGGWRDFDELFIIQFKFYFRVSDKLRLVCIITEN